MGLLIDGVWQDDVSRTKDGHFIRPAAQFRNWVTPDGSAGPSGEAGFPAESGRYHLYVSLACPWAHRTIIFRKLKALENVISLSVVSPQVGREGWTFNKSEGSTGDDVNGKSKLSEIYLLANPRYSGRVWLFYTIRPTHWDWVGLDESHVWRDYLSDRGCAMPKPYLQFENLAITFAVCR